MKRTRWIWKFFVLGLVLPIWFAVGAMADEAVISGVIKKTEDGIVLAIPNGESFVIFNQDLSNLVGKSVKITGVLEEGPYGKSIRVESVQKIKD
ncbi:MAG: hypothetical protein M0036_17515 [Desulfobacteraceae bacterium]|nr:hypothetical protein [Desulfobacteraceae bacterium]